MLHSKTTKWKGSADGVAALVELKKRYPGLQAHLFGIESRAEDLPEWIEHYSNPTQATIREIYNRSAIFLAPSWAEGWPLPPCEAMSCGAALVATNIGGHLEYCIDGETALLAEVRNPSDLAEKTASLIDNPNERIALAHRGQEYVQRFTWERALNSLEMVLAGNAAYSEID
jgi:glycosyltransferase involved in cell wall biosynthesis